MTPSELSEAFEKETERVEWKQSDRDTNDLLRAVCALANDLGNSKKSGFLIIGMRNDGTVEGVSVEGKAADKPLQSLVSRLQSANILPNPSINVELVSHAGKSLFVVQVEPYPVPPVVMVDGVPWVRRGPSTVRAIDADVLRLRERRPDKNHPFDLRPWVGATLGDLSELLLRPMYAAARDNDRDPETFPDFEGWLAQRELGRDVGGVWTPTPAAMLLFGLSPQSFFPGAIVELVRYGGTDFDAEVLWRKTVTGTLGDQLDALWTHLSTLVTSIPGAPVGARTPYVPTYPVDALKELARNLVQHRLYESTNAPGRIEWFDDRVVFSNPGGSFGRASEGEFGNHSDYRNPNLTRGLVDLGYVERLGRGVRLVKRLLEKNGNAPLEHETDGFTTVVVRSRT